MRPVLGVSLELTVLALGASIGLEIPGGLPFALYTIVLELAATYLAHCPAHYLVGSAVGIRFRSMRLSRTTLARVLPAKMGGLAQFLPVLTLSVDRGSLGGVSKGELSAMYASGTIASVCAAFAVALASPRAEPAGYAMLAWAIATAYLAFDVVFSPRSGDLMRARIAKSPP